MEVAVNVLGSGTRKYEVRYVKIYIYTKRTLQFQTFVVVVVVVVVVVMMMMMMMMMMKEGQPKRPQNHAENT
jgi:F0F1-type ATP synthase membrane subunit a